MTEDQIRETIAKVLAELGIEAPTAKGQRKDHEIPNAARKGEGRRQDRK